MRFFQPPADVRFYAGVDLHAKSLVRGRWSPQACWVRLVLGLWGQESRPPWIETAGSPTDDLRRRCCDPGARRVRETQITPWPWNVFSLDGENLMRVRP